MDQVLANGNHYVYTGKVQPKRGERDATGRPLAQYLPSDALVEAVNLAIYLERPLLLKGEPGCGKTRLAQAVAYELDLPYEAWYIKSTSKARDRSEEHTSELQSPCNLVCRLLLEKKKN